MDISLATIAQHGYAILFTVVFLEAIGLPLPAALALLLAGGAAALGSLNIWYALGGSFAAMLIGDTLMFFLGRYTGWWLLGMLCRVSLNPESCILRSADSFYRRGKMLLLIAKFIPGINTLAPPLAGSMNMRVLPFFKLDVAGAALFVGAYFALGFIFSEVLEAVTQGLQKFGQMMGALVIALVAAYLAFVLGLWVKGRATQRAVPFVTPSDAAHGLAAGARIYDVRNHGYLDAKATRIRGSLRLDPNALHQSVPEFPPEQPV